MWIELPDELEKDILNINNEYDKLASVLNELFESMYKGKHVIYCSPDLLVLLSNNCFITNKMKSYIKWILNKYLLFYSAEDIMDYKIIVTSDEKIRVSNCIYYVPYEILYDIRETSFITEHESDAVFYKYIFDHINKYFKCNDYSVCLENISGHGTNIPSTIDECLKKNRITLCITDSDKDYDNCDYGGTYKKAKEVYDDRKDDSIFMLDVLGVREKENLFSPNIYKEFSKQHIKFLTVLEKFIDNENVIKYFDIKEGVKYQQYLDSFWLSYYLTVVDELKNEKIFHLPKENEEEGKYCCISGIGRHLNEEVCMALLCDKEEFEKIKNSGKYNKKKLQLIVNWRKTLNDLLPDFIFEEWVRLYKIMFSWGCCMSENTKPYFVI